MEFKTFLKKNVFVTFFITSTCISIAMAVLGMYFMPDEQFGYGRLLAPPFFALMITLPLFVTYSSKELNTRQIIIRRIIQLVLIEGIILGVLLYDGALTSVSVVLAVILSVLVVYITVELVLWVNDSITARKFNKALKTLQNRMN